MSSDIRLATLSGTGSLREFYDLVVIGAGPAGMSAAITASEQGLSVLVVDRGTAPGGQIYRGVGNASADRKRLLGADYARGGALVDTFRRAGCDYLPGATVWYLDTTPEVGISASGRSRIISCSHVLLATGAMERPATLPGWTLPGIMNAGAAQIMLKTGGVVAGGKVVLAGSGPLLWLVASQYAAAGKAPDLVIDTTPATARLRALPLAPGFLLSGLAGKGAALLARTYRSGKVVSGAQLLGVEQREGGRFLRYIRRGRETSVGFDHLFLHQGLVPEINLPASAGLRLAWNEGRAAFEPERDAWGISSAATISIAGDGGSIAGAKAAWHDGALAALEICHRLGRTGQAERDRLADPVRKRHRAAMRGRAFLETLFRPDSAAYADDTILCRCEEVTAGQLRKALEHLPVEGPNQWKALSRCGMGPCQGRQCGLSVSATIAAHTGRSMDSIGYYRLRPPVFPVPLAELATMETPQE